MKVNFLPQVACTKHDGIKVQKASLPVNSIAGAAAAGVAAIAIKTIDSFVKKQPKQIFNKANLKFMGIVTLAAFALSLVTTAVLNNNALKRCPENQL